MSYEMLLPHCKTKHQKDIIQHLINYDGDKNATCEYFSMFRTNLDRILRQLRAKNDIGRAKELDILVIADTQIDKHSPTDHLDALSKYIWEHKPKTIVHIGDHWDFPSLSSYSSRLSSEGKRFKDDLDSGIRAFRRIMATTETENDGSYQPNKHFLMGNHENRLDRFIAENPMLDGFIDLSAYIKKFGWTVNKMNDPLWIGDVCFNHYMENPMSGRPVGGAMENKLNKFPHSFVHGHQQQYQYARRQNLKGQPHFGVCAGSFYMHDEDYRGSNNTEIRGFTHLRGFTNRYGYIDHDVEFVSMERLLETYQ